MAKTAKKSKNLDPNQILIAEFHYAEQTAFQANQDRLALYNYFFSTGGALVAAVILGNFDSNFSRVIFTIVFLGLAFWGVISYLKLIKIREAWNSSIMAMNQIKTYYQKNLSFYDISEAFRWTAKTKPEKGRIWSITFLMGLLFAVVDGFMFGMGVYLVSGDNQFQAAAAAILFFLFHYVLWRVLLKD